MLIHLIAAARPNFMKIAPLYHALKKEDWAKPIIVHTGQHYDLNMSDAFIEDLGLPHPDIHLGIGSGTHAEQTGNIMIAYEKVLEKNQPDLIVVVGDVNSTMACALATSKVQYPVDSRQYAASSTQHPRTSNQFQVSSFKHQVSNIPAEVGIFDQHPVSSNLRRPLIAHLEAGLRSFDRTMPEEINRLVTDALADILWTPSPDADDNLLKEGISPNKIQRVGNIMIDSLEMLRKKIEKEVVYKDFGLNTGDYGLITLHRPSNVDDPGILESICRTLTRIAETIPLIFPIHPRTRKNLDKHGLMPLLRKNHNLRLVNPLRYIHFMNLVFNCRFAITDSGGIQEETTYLGIPCLTMRPNTERPITIDQGTNQLCTIENLESLVDNVLLGVPGQSRIPEYWDGRTAVRVLKSINDLL